jgi:adenine-specific DNA-methyltransferase
VLPVTNPKDAASQALRSAPFTLFFGDCKKLLAEMPEDSVDLIVSSPPYFMGKDYDKSKNIADFETEHKEIAPLLNRILKQGGSLCWQVGYHVKNNQLIPLDIIAYNVFRTFPDLILRNRIIWTYQHGVHSRRRFSGRHEVILWFSKGDISTFNLDDVRIPQKYPGKRHYKGPHKGLYSGHPLGKNPGDVWSIPNVNATHVEKTNHPCQYPVALAQRLILALTKKEALVLDPFAGASSTGIAAVLEGRRFLGAETKKAYIEASVERYEGVVAGTLRTRPLHRPIYEPSPSEKVAQRPSHFRAPTSEFKDAY